jgi:hypothetical protein
MTLQIHLPQIDAPNNSQSFDIGPNIDLLFTTIGNCNWEQFDIEQYSNCLDYFAFVDAVPHCQSLLNSGCQAFFTKKPITVDEPGIDHINYQSQTPNPPIYYTPLAIVQRITQLHGFVLSKDTPTLAELIRDYSRFPIPTYKSRSTGAQRITQTFYCAWKKKYPICHSYIKFAVKNNIVKIAESNWTHCHPFNVSLIKSRYNLNKDQIHQIDNLTHLQIKSGAIRVALDLNCSTNVLYEHRRDILKDQKQNDLPKLFQKSREWVQWKAKFFNENGSLQIIIFLNIPIMEKDLSKNTFFMDDTANTNHKGSSFVGILTPDENEHFQLVCFGFLTHTTSQLFCNFLQELKNNLIAIPQCFMVDRNKAQFNAIESIFPTTKIAFCHLHLASNLKSYFQDRHITSTFWMPSKSITNQNQFVDLLQQVIDDNTSTEHQKRFCRTLIDEKTHWLKSEILPFTIYRTTSPIEGFFANLKSMISFEAGSLYKVANAARLIGEKRLIESQSCNNISLPTIVMTQETSKEIGRFAQLKLLKQWNKIEYIKDLEEECQCVKFWSMALPCKHKLMQLYLANTLPLSTRDIPVHYQKHVFEENRIIPDARKCEELLQNIEIPDFNLSIEQIKEELNAYLQMAEVNREYRVLLRDVVKDLDSHDLQQESL